MTQTPPIIHAVAVELRRVDTDALVGIALVLSSERYVSLISQDTGVASKPVLSDEAWRDVEAWDEDVAARLPFKPEPMNATTVNELLGGGTLESEVIARRFAAIPISVQPHDSLTPFFLDNILPSLWSSRTT